MHNLRFYCRKEINNCIQALKGGEKEKVFGNFEMNDDGSIKIKPQEKGCEHQWSYFVDEFIFECKKCGKIK
jgi:hypothetical protein